MLGARLPSIMTRWGIGLSLCTALCIPFMVAWSMFTRSISSASTNSTENAMAWFSICGSNCSRRFSVSFFESSSQGSSYMSGSMTAATTTGPASGPRPASSTPASKTISGFAISIGDMLQNYIGGCTCSIDT